MVVRLPNDIGGGGDEEVESCCGVRHHFEIHNAIDDIDVDSC